VSVIAAQQELYQRSVKQRPIREYVCGYVFRPAAQVVVVALLPLRVPPPAVVLANAACGLAGAAAIVRGNLVVGALLLQAKTLLDNADGQLARASGRTSVLGRYLDSESDLLVNAAILAAVGYWTDQPLLAAVAFCVLTLVLSVDFNLERLYRRERGDERDPSPPATGRIAHALERVYAFVYAPQDRAIEHLVERRLGDASAEARLAYHDRLTLSVLANMGLSTQLAVLGVCLALGHPAAYCWFVVGCGVLLVPLFLRSELLARRTSPTRR
jgi:phosphatidylglycerophosphate synthase